MSDEADGVPRADLAAQYRELQPELDRALQTLLARAELVGGPTLAAFERAFAERCGVAAAVGVSSGTAALMLALDALGVGSGDEVIVPGFTFVATAAAVVHCGAKPVFADVRASDLSIDPDDVARRINERTRAIVPVHLFGRVGDVDALGRLGLPIVEDAAQAFGATRDGRSAGALGTLGCFSLHPSKNLGVAGDGGVITTDDAGVAAGLRARINHGRGPGGEHQIIGFNHRLDALQAAVGLVKLPHVGRWTARRRDHARAYDEALRGLDLGLPELVDGHVFHQYAVLSDARDALASHLSRDRIEVAKFYARPVYAEPAFAGYAPARPCPVTEDLCRRVLCLPVHAELKDAQREKVIASIRRFFGA